MSASRLGLGFGFCASRGSERKRQKRVFIGLSLVLGFNNRLKNESEAFSLGSKNNKLFWYKKYKCFCGLESYNDWQFKPLKKAYSLFI